MGSKIKEKKYNVPGITVADNLDLNIGRKDSLEDVLNEVLVHPTLHLTHPKDCLVTEPPSRQRASVPEGLSSFV
jgi:hypothetical protein